MKIGILALQGDISEHRVVLEKLDAEVIEVRTVDDLASVDRLILPGGESTTMMRLLQSTGLDQEIVKRVKEGMPVFGTCAGAIILSQLGLMDIEVERNAYGSQLQSFEADITAKGIDDPIHVSFIRAPVITSVGSEVEVLAECMGCPVLVKKGNVLAATFHAEVHRETTLHTKLLSL